MVKARLTVRPWARFSEASKGTPASSMRRADVLLGSIFIRMTKHTRTIVNGESLQ
jgi:hypothetical protein